MQTITHHYQLSFPHTPSAILDIWILHPTYHLVKTEKGTFLEGSYTIHTWYEYHVGIFPLSDTYAFPISYVLEIDSPMIRMKQEPFSSHYSLLSNGMIDIAISLSFSS